MNLHDLHELSGGVCRGPRTNPLHFEDDPDYGQNPGSGSFLIKKIQKSEKNSEVGGWVKPQLGFFSFLEISCGFCIFCCCCICFQFFFFKWIGGLVGGVWPIRVFLGFLDFYSLTRTLNDSLGEQHQIENQKVTNSIISFTEIIFLGVYF